MREGRNIRMRKTQKDRISLKASQRQKLEEKFAKREEKGSEEIEKAWNKY